MSKDQAVLNVIYKALEDLNAEKDAENKIDIRPDTPLYGDDSVLDSLDLVSVIVDIETEVSARFNATISLTDDQAMSRTPAPFLGVAPLKDYILEQLATGT